MLKLSFLWCGKFQAVFKSNRLEKSSDIIVSIVIKFVVFGVKTSVKSVGWDWQLTNCSRGIRNAWHFQYVLV